MTSVDAMKARICEESVYVAVCCEECFFLLVLLFACSVQFRYNVTI